VKEWLTNGGWEWLIGRPIRPNHSMTSTVCLGESDWDERLENAVFYVMHIEWIKRQWHQGWANLPTKNRKWWRDRTEQRGVEYQRINT